MFALVLAGLVSFGRGAAAQSEVVGHIYVNDNAATTNTIASFDRHADGSFTPTPGSPFATGGAGTGAIIGSQGALQITDDGRFLLAVDAGSNQISVLSVAEDGALTAIDGGTVDSGGKTPVSIAVHEDLVYVANTGDGTDGASYAGFRLSDEGILSPIDGSTMPLSATAAPGDILFNDDGTVLIGVQVGPDAGPSAIDSFLVAEDGTLTKATGSPFTPQAIGPFGSVFSPTEPRRLYVTNAHAGPNHGSVSAYDVDTDGALAPVAGSPFVTRQSGTCWIAIAPDGKHVFAVNTGNSSISRFEVLADGGLKLLGNIALNDATGLRPFDARLDSEGTHLYVVDAGLAAISVFEVEGGDLTEVSASPIELPMGATPFGIVVV